VVRGGNSRNRRTFSFGQFTPTALGFSPLDILVPTRTLLHPPIHNAGDQLPLSFSSELLNQYASWPSYDCLASILSSCFLHPVWALHLAGTELLRQDINAGVDTGNDFAWNSPGLNLQQSRRQLCQQTQPNTDN